MKVKAQAEGHSSIRNVAKLLMNSLYGRFGMHTDNSITELVPLERTRELMKIYPIISVISLGGLELINYIVDSAISPSAKAWKKSKYQLPGQTNVPIAASITAYSRMIINQFKLHALNSGLDIFYSDTDSLVLSGKLSAEYIDPAKLGLLKLEHVIEEGYFVAPKIYWLINDKGVEVSKCKGFPGKLSKEQVISLYQGRPLELEVTKWSRNLGQSSVRINRGLPYVLSPGFNKRQKLLDPSGAWVDTKPLFLGQSSVTVRG